MSIYIITNKEHGSCDKYKVGKTTSSSKGIIKQYERTLPCPHLVFHHKCKNHSRVERILLKTLRDFRVPDSKEWFQIPYFELLDITISTLKQKGIDYNFEIDMSKLLRKFKVEELKILTDKKGKKDILIEYIISNGLILSKLKLIDDSRLIYVTGKKNINEAVTCFDSLLQKDKPNRVLNDIIQNLDSRIFSKSPTKDLTKLTCKHLKLIGAKGTRKDEMIRYIQKDGISINLKSIKDDDCKNIAQRLNFEWRTKGIFLKELQTYYKS